MLKIKISLFLFIITLVSIVTQNTFAAEKPLEVIDNKIYEQILDDLNLNSKDIKAYKNLFDATDEERWDKEEKRREKIDNDILLGHALAKKYLSKSYKSSYEDLVEWLEKYNDLPQYKRIYWLANKKGDNESTSDALKYSQAFSIASSGYNWYLDDLSKLSDESKQYVLDKVRDFRKHLNSGKTLKAKQILEDEKLRKIIPNKSWDAMSTTLATVYFIDGYDKQALQWATKPATRSKEVTAYWFGGLAAWRLGNYKKSAELFDALARLELSDEWVVSAGGYWAYRSHLKLKDNAKAQQALKEAAKHKRTFYGILACNKLGEDVKYNWKISSYNIDLSSKNYVDNILSSPALKRAVVLASIDQNKLASAEIMNAYPTFDDAQKELAMFIAKQYGMNLVAIQISNSLKDTNSNRYYDYISYPYPNWDKKVWNADKALVLALIRQESAFHNDAVSGAGARGLMQLMPNTAVYVTKNKKIKEDLTTLFDSEYNLEIGQKYVNYLLEKPYIDGNLFFLATAYNAGPGNLLKWKNKTKYNDDPLLFIEAIPSRQTRIYIKRVMTNYWVYNSRLKKKNPSLSEVAKNQWPTL